MGRLRLCGGRIFRETLHLRAKRGQAALGIAQRGGDAVGGFLQIAVAASILASTAASCAFSTAMLAAMPSADSASPAFALLFSTFAWATMAAASSFAFSMCAVA